MTDRTDSKARILLMLLAVTLLGGGLGFRLVYWQLNRHQQITALVAQDTAPEQTVPAKRGTIYDRTGTVVLAETVDRYRITANLHDLTTEERQRYGDELTDYLELDGAAAAKLRTTLQSTAYYIVLATNVEPDVATEIAQAQSYGALTALTLEDTPVRIYPQAGGAPHTSLAAHLLGFVNASGVGQYGLEQAYDSVLAGKPETIRVNPSRPGPLGWTVVDPGTPGKDIITTIDATLQLQIEQEVFATWLADKAKAVSAVVMDPKSGAVFAEASYPSYDANEYQAVANQDQSRFIDPVISQQYEPGSVFKMLTASAALQTKTTSLTTKINDTGVMKLAGGLEVADADRKAKGMMTFADIVAWSRNVGVSQAAFRLGKTVNAASDVLYRTWQTYGIGHKTGIDLAGETAGYAPDPSNPDTPWYQIDLANRSFGQAVAVPPIQLMKAYSEMANGGFAVTPHVAQGDIRAALATATAAATPDGTRIISTSLSSSLTTLMEHVTTAVPSYNQATYIPGYYVGGKTGTAQIWDPTANGGRGDWMGNDTYNYSFFGWVGTSSPDLTVGVVIYQGTPTKVGQGILDMPVQSTDMFRRVATDAVNTLSVPANPNGPKPPSGKKTPSLG
jgi:cell division protein FtsI/penicillin-binding protein 2